MMQSSSSNMEIWLNFISCRFHFWLTDQLTYHVALKAGFYQTRNILLPSFWITFFANTSWKFHCELTSTMPIVWDYTNLSTHEICQSLPDRVRQKLAMPMIHYLLETRCQHLGNEIWHLDMRKWVSLLKHPFCKKSLPYFTHKEGTNFLGGYWERTLP